MNTPNFSDIYTLYFEDVYKYLLALCHDEELAEELAQDTFFKAMKSYENFRGDCKITTWLCQIAKHSFFLYEKHRKRNIDLNSVENEIVDTNSIEILLGQREQAFGIHKLLHNLPEPYKEVFSLRVLGELSYQDIAKLFGKTESWARVTFHRAKLKIIEQVNTILYLSTCKKKGFNIMMKQKKIIVPILTLAVMLLMVGGVYAVFSSTQPEKSKAENVRDTTDQDYEKGLTEEQKAFNELINKQIYEETANNLEQYEQYGLTYNSNENQLFFNGKSVCYFADNRATDGTFEGTEVHSANGDIGIITERDRNGNITGLKQMEIPELTDFLEKSWKEK